MIQTYVTDLIHHLLVFCCHIKGYATHIPSCGQGAWHYPLHVQSCHGQPTIQSNICDWLWLCLLFFVSLLWSTIMYFSLLAYIEFRNPPMQWFFFLLLTICSWMEIFLDAANCTYALNATLRNWMTLLHHGTMIQHMDTQQIDIIILLHYTSDKQHWYDTWKRNQCVCSLIQTTIGFWSYQW